MNEQPTRQQTLRQQEVGYVILEECHVLIPKNVHDDDNISSSQVQVWHGINIQQKDDTINYCKDDDDGISFNNYFGEDGYDNVCDLILQPSRVPSDSTNNDYCWENVNEVHPFNGLLSEIYTSSSELPSIANAKKRKSNNRNEDKKSPPKRRRSDASLLVGLSVEINNQADNYYEQQQPISGDDSGIENSDNLHLRQLRTSDVKVMFWGEEEEDESSLSNTKCSEKFVRMKASLLVTYSLPIIYNQNAVSSAGKSDNEGSSSHVPKKEKRLSSGYQLLGSIIRCDWEYLDVRMKKLQQKALAEKNTTSITSCQEEQKSSPRKPFFPDSLNVGELYERISGASKYFDQDTSEEGKNGGNTDNNSDTTDVEFLDLPEDVISTSIAPYLHAPSLHSLRVSNRKMYKCLRANVPGLKLKLFQHQIRSLEWMEMRERRCITEDDVLCRHKDKNTSDYFLHGGESVCGGDYHRAVTGGSTVLLSPKLNIDANMTLLRFDSESGCKICLDSRGVPSKTRCARGG